MRLASLVLAAAALLVGSAAQEDEPWFTELEDITYSVVEYIPFVGTLYSLKRAGLAAELALPAEAILLHTMAESFTDRMVQIYASDEPETIQVNRKPAATHGHILVAEGAKGKLANHLFDGKAKGVHHFHRAVFNGTIKHPKYAPNGEEIRFRIPHGLYDGAPVTISWKWTSDARGVTRRPEATFGFIQLEPGTPTRFRLSKRKGAGGWEGYDFWGDILSADHIKATIGMDGSPQIDFERVVVAKEER